MPRVAVSLAVLSLLAAGCGGGGGGRLSKSEYASKADAICAKYNSQIQKLGSPRSMADISAFAGKAVPIARKGNADLRALKPPKDEDATAKSWLDANTATVDAIEHLRDAAEKNDQGKIQASLKEGNRSNAAADKLARKLGLKVCAKG